MKAPGRNIFILAAVCISIVIISIVVKEKSKRVAASKQVSTLFATTSSSTITNIRDIIVNNEADLALATNTNPFAPSESDTLTDTLSKNIFLSYVKYDAQGLLDSQEGPDQIAENILLGIDTEKLPQSSYTYNQVKVFTPTIAGDLINYGNQYAQAEVGNLSLIKKNPKQYNNNLSAIGELYKTIGADMMKIKTPFPVATNHLAIANAYDMMGQSLINISQSTEDPLKATLSVKVFKESVTTQYTNYMEIADYIQGSGIIFAENAPGAIFNKKTTKSAPAKQ